MLLRRKGRQRRGSERRRSNLRRKGRSGKRRDGEEQRRAAQYPSSYPSTAKASMPELEFQVQVLANLSQMARQLRIAHPSNHNQTRIHPDKTDRLPILYEYIAAAANSAKVLS